MGVVMSNSGACAVAAAVVAADFVSGDVHWAEDTDARFKPARKLRLINAIALDNDLHHRRPREFLARTSWQSSWDLALFGLAIVTAAWTIGALICALLAFVLLSVNANQLHKWTHRNPRENAWWVTRLQHLFLLQTPRHHGRHHAGERKLALLCGHQLS